MSDRTFAALFGGGDLAGVGARQAGLRPIWSIEIDGEIAGVAEMNGLHTIVADVCDVDFSGLERPWWLHMSPPCINASIAKADRGETEGDIALAVACCRAIEALEPARVSLENVWGYCKFEALRLIRRCLSDLGYDHIYWHLNSADYGVPQTRKRLILVARRDRAPQKPAPTHHDPASVKTVPGQLSLLDDAALPWVGWYEAVSDIVHTFPESRFAPWQLKRLPENIKTFLMMTDNTSFSDQARPGVGVVDMDRPANSVYAANVTPRAFILEGTASGENNPFPLPARGDSAPVFTIKGTPGALRAFLVESKNANQEWAKGSREGNETAYSVVTDHKDSHRPFTILVPGAQGDSFPLRGDGDPSPTVTNVGRVGNLPRAVIVSGGLNDRGVSLTHRSGDEPCFSVTTSHNNRDVRAAVRGRVVRITPRGLARFQSIPDQYRLPEKNALAVKVVGNAVPSLLMQRIIESQLR